MKADLVSRTRREILGLGLEGLDWVMYTTQVSEALRRVIAFEASCWHTVDPNTVLFTGSVNRHIACSGSWLAEHEYVNDDVNKWAFLARSGRLAGATSLATQGDLAQSARHRSHEAYGIGDELRGSFVVDGVYWGAVGFPRQQDDPYFTEEDVDTLASLSESIAAGLRRALLITAVTASEVSRDQDGPGVVVFDDDGQAEFISPAAEWWIGQMIEIPRPVVPAQSKAVQGVAARARSLQPGQDPLELAARSRARTHSGRWLLLYGTKLTGGSGQRTAVIIQPAAPNDVAPLVALAYGLSERERDVSRLCMNGRSTKEIAKILHVSPYTVQDHVQSIFDKTGVRTRGELVGQIFLEHYVPRWEKRPDSPQGWLVTGSTSPQPTEET
jgi:DNA-binding CsgD family transcriptional regulator